MACSLTSGIDALDCRDLLGGVEEIYVAALSGNSIVGATSTGNSVSGITFGAVSIGSVADLTGNTQTFKLNREGSSLTETGTFSEEAFTAFYSQVLSVLFNKVQSSSLDVLNDLGRNRLVVVAKDYNGTYFVLGNENGALLSNSTGETGAAWGDRNGFTLEFTGFSKTPMWVLDI